MARHPWGHAALLSVLFLGYATTSSERSAASSYLRSRTSAAGAPRLRALDGRVRRIDDGGPLLGSSLRSVGRRGNPGAAIPLRERHGGEPS